MKVRTAKDPQAPQGAASQLLQPAPEMAAA